MLHHYTTTELIWLGFGLVGQALFSGRFLVQWLCSEREGRSVIPVAFWYLSFAGGLTLFVYAAVYLRDPVFTLGQCSGLFIYARNLHLIWRERKKIAVEAEV